MDEELVAPSSADIIEGQYIVVFNKDITGNASSKYPQSYTKAQEEVANTTKRVLSETNIPETELLAVYSKTINGAALKLTLKQVEALRGKKKLLLSKKIELCNLRRLVERQTAGLVMEIRVMGTMGRRLFPGCTLRDYAGEWCNFLHWF